MIFCSKHFRQSILCPVGAKKIIFDDSLVGQPTKTFPKYGLSRVFIARICHFFNFVDFRVYFGHFSLVKSAKNKIAFLQQKDCSNQKIEEKRWGLEFNFLLKSKCASLNFDFWFLTEPYCPCPCKHVIFKPSHDVNNFELRYYSIELHRTSKIAEI